MKKFSVKNLNTPSYWDASQTALDFGLRQKKYVKLAGRGERIVDLGCGLSPFLEHAPFNERWGVDFSPVTIKTLREKNQDIDYLCEDIRKTSFDDKYFDVAVCGEAIEHMEDPIALIEEMVRITKKRIIISTPQLEFEDPEHIWEFSEEDLISMLGGFGKVKVETVESERFPGRRYLFAVCELS